MDGPIEQVPALPAIAMVRAAGKTYTRRMRHAQLAHTALVAAIRDAYGQGATITQLAAASGLSRPAVYRAVADLQDQ